MGFLLCGGIGSRLQERLGKFESFVCLICLLSIDFAYTVQNNSYLGKQQWKRMNGSQGVQHAYMRNGPAFNVNSATKWRETYGMTSGGNTVSLKWLSLSGLAKVFLCLWGVSNEAHVLPEARHQAPLAPARHPAWTSDSCSDLALDVGCQSPCVSGFQPPN